jgi:nucleotide-binding universal stress UspA family protein
LPRGPDAFTVKRVLCATDFSDGVAAALDVAVSFARACEAEVRIVHVCPPALDRPGAAGEVGRDPIEGLARCRRRTTAAGVTARSLLLQGDPAAEILREADRAAVDLIAMGRHVPLTPDHRVLDSVTERVVREAPCPVLVSCPRRRGDPPRHVLCGLDLGPAAADTLVYAAAVTEAFDADLLVLHVAGESGVEDAWAAVDAAVATTSARSGRVRQEVVAGVPGEQIMAAADKDATDLVVVGSHGGGVVARPFLGSTTLHLLRHSECPVLVVPCKREKVPRPPPHALQPVASPA